MEYMIEVDKVSKCFGQGDAGVQILNEVSFGISKGEFVSLMGASGSGKSTMLYLIGGLDRDFSGSIRIDGQNIGDLKEKDLSALRLKKIGFIFQFYNLVQNLSVEDNILLPLTVNGYKASQLKKEVTDILELTGLLEKRKAMPSQLSGGQQQRVAIARAILGNPEILLTDEATGNLDSHAGEEIMNLFKEINREKKITILQVTHSSVCAGYGDRTIYLENGSIMG